MTHAPTILIIDDETEQLIVRKMLFETAGYHVVTANSGREGIRVFQDQLVDVALVDYWMADMKGIAVASEIKRLRPEVPIAIFSALRPLPDEALGKANVWLMKAEMEPEELLETIETLLERGKPR